MRVSDGQTTIATAPSAVIGHTNPAPTATLSNNGPVCAGGSTTVSLQLTGTAPWSLTYTYKNELGMETAVSQTGITTSPFTFSTGVLLASRAYTLTQLSDANGCAAQSLPLTSTVAVSSRPSVTVLPVLPVCAGTSAVLTGVLTGIGPWTVYYTINGNPQQQTVSGLGAAGLTSFNYRFSTVPLTTGGTITSVSVSDGSCLTFPNVSTTVEVTPSTTWTGLVSGEWANDGNWTNCIPSRYLDARIPKLGLNSLGLPLVPYPSFTTASGQTTAEVKNLTIEDSAAPA